SRCIVLSGNFLYHVTVINYVVLSIFSFVDGIFFFSSRRRHTRSKRDWSSDVCSSDLMSFLLTNSSAPSSPSSLAVPLRLTPPKRSEERRVGKGVDLGGRRIINKKKKK